MLDLKDILLKVRKGQIEIDEALEILKYLPFEDLGFAKIDFHRSLRRGVPEVIFCQGKKKEQIVKIVDAMMKKGSNIMGTRASEDVVLELKTITENVQYFKEARIFYIENKRVLKNKGKIAVVCAGTSDIPVAEEAAVTAEIFGNKVERLYDVGVAGIHRLFMNLNVLNEANVVIVVAGMEGALASVVAGVIDKPVIAVPTSVGYGANFNGLSALLTMLNSCAGGITVVNIDNGFGAGFAAHLINRLGGIEDEDTLS
ncbi:MAG: nickel pincer cofactor biosynthesis protein LarB [Thermovenabulum sp.]|uniref:nickel pincer cofactor biosynthesis protein LarB n=1 Tax=Thermovenabulum sp. TaxID=3100335 RepID=UPI003C7A3129